MQSLIRGRGLCCATKSSFENYVSLSLSVLKKKGIIKMANFGNNQNFWDGQGQNQNQNQDFNFEMPDQFGNEL